MNLGKQNKSVWSVILIWLGILVAFTVIALLCMIIPSLFASVLYHWSAIGKAECRQIGNNLLIIFTVLRYVIAVWLLCLANKYWFKEKLSFNNWHWSWNVIIVTVAALIFYLYNFSTLQIGFNVTDMSNLCFTFGPAIFEEIWFRGIVLLTLVKVFSQHRHGILQALFLSAIMFGCIHLFFSDMTLSDTVLNACGAAGTGLLFGALYLRTKNLLLPMVLHFAADFGANFLATTALNDLSLVSIVVQILVDIVFALFLLRKTLVRDILS
ncbi:CPBP family intramembrane metalloprotease [Lactobacillus sp. ESL0791]|uniref:CPBP family intramembrane glutamic endopeptidase n=1 Tax=Lactobacillus sp. ESL0791 TaxID=2983234 RepID=UPI0023F8CC32|nr:CPBP family intramembrane glutamic endopeptidase [Lactobacillus sp. ESL0791]MDF7638354.1 CPBP family intramembrane metalloprotease [Lactobacillus sp. ESL0791]